jgi:hypothetical protein
MIAPKSAQMEDFKMKYGEVNGELVEATERGERATCRECQTELYARLRPHSGHEFTWVHFVAGDCSLSYDREYSGGNYTSSNMEQVIVTAVAEPITVMPTNDDERIRELKRKVRLSGELNDAHECILLAIKGRLQSSISGIAAGLKTNLLKHGNVIAEDIIALNAMTTKRFYLAEQRRLH